VLLCDIYITINTIYLGSVPNRTKRAFGSLAANYLAWKEKEKLESTSKQRQRYKLLMFVEVLRA
jgi:hypothetical protein